MPTERTEPDAQPSVPDALSIIRDQQREAALRLNPDPRIMFGTWGLAWVVGYGTTYLTSVGVLETSGLLAGLVFAGALVVAAIVTGVHLSRRLGGVDGPSARYGSWYGMGYGFVLLATGALFAGITRLGMSPEAIAALWSIGFPFVVGLMNVVGGALWRDRLQLVLGAWIMVVSAAAPHAGMPTAQLVVAAAGGGGMLAAAAWFLPRSHR